MRWRIRAMRDMASYGWHRWFAWHPVFAEDTGEWIWLEPVARRWLGGQAECYEYETFQ
jgi:hypothetical protein